MEDRPRSLRIARGATYVTRPSLPPFEEYARLLRRVWASRVLTNNGPLLVTFEGLLRRYLRVRYVDAVANGTLALQLALRALFPRGGAVVTTPFTFAATTTALIWEGYSPDFVDVDAETFNLDPELVEPALTDQTSGVLSVHVFGNVAGSDRLGTLCRRHGTPVVFDGAHAFGVRLDSAPVYDRGDATTLSFHATKGFHSFEGGAVVSASPQTSRRVRLMRNFGITSEETVELVGINAKMNEAQAAMGLANLRHIDRWIRERRLRYLLYVDLLREDHEIEFQKVDLRGYNFTYMPILLASRRVRDRVHELLVRRRVYPRKYFYPLTSSPAFSRKFLRRKLPIATDIADRILTLPIYPDLPLAHVRRISRWVRLAIREDSA